MFDSLLPLSPLLLFLNISRSHNSHVSDYLIGLAADISEEDRYRLFACDKESKRAFFGVWVRLFGTHTEKVLERCH